MRNPPTATAPGAPDRAARAGIDAAASSESADSPDEVLMAAVAAGRTAALSTLFDRHARRLFGFLRGLVGGSGAAEDLVQETFLRVLGHRETYRAGAPFVPWLLTIARNAAWAHLRKAGRMPTAEMPELAQPSTLEQRQIERQRAGRLTRALRRLPARDREVLLLSYFEDLRHAEIAAIVGSTAGAVKVRAHRARASLRDLLAGEEGEPRDRARQGGERT